MSLSYLYNNVVQSIDNFIFASFCLSFLYEYAFFSHSASSFFVCIALTSWNIHRGNDIHSSYCSNSYDLQPKPNKPAFFYFTRKIEKPDKTEICRCKMLLFLLMLLWQHGARTRKDSRALSAEESNHYLLRAGNECANISESSYEEGDWLHEEVKEIVVFPKCNIIASAEEEIGTSCKL